MPNGPCFSPGLFWTQFLLMLEMESEVTSEEGSVKSSKGLRLFSKCWKLKDRNPRWVVQSGHIAYNLFFSRYLYMSEAYFTVCTVFLAGSGWDRLVDATNGARQVGHHAEAKFNSLLILGHFLIVSLFWVTLSVVRVPPPHTSQRKGWNVRRLYFQQFDTVIVF